MRRDLDKEVLYRELVQRSCREMSLYREYRDVAKRPFVEILRRHLAWTSVEILSKVLLYRDVLQRSCLETSDRETLYTEILPRCLLQHPDTEISHRDFAMESLSRDLA